MLLCCYTAGHHGEEEYVQLLSEVSCLLCESRTDTPVHLAIRYNVPDVIHMFL